MYICTCHPDGQVRGLVLEGGPWQVLPQAGDAEGRGGPVQVRHQAAAHDRHLPPARQDLP